MKASSNAMAGAPLFLGIDFGTSGCRASVIDGNATVICETAIATPPPTVAGKRVTQSVSVWLDALEQLFQRIRDLTDSSRIERLAIDGTSGSLLLSDPDGQPLTPALMYNDASSVVELDELRAHCPETEHLCLNLSSGVVKAMQLAKSHNGQPFRVLNQADFISNFLSKQWGVSDYHNALKLGYDCSRLCWPEWVRSLFPAGALPRVVEPGAVIGAIDGQLAARYGLSERLQICAGSTDANAAFLAAGLTRPGQAITSLGSTLVLKMLTETALQDLKSGVYSHRLGDYWLAGGASNAGAAILRDYFSDDQIAALSRQIDPHRASGLQYYPLRATGERFPLYDPHKQPLLEPRPDSDVTFLHGLLEGLAAIEKAGYDALERLGGPALVTVKTAGGGAKNEQWRAMRQSILGKPVEISPQTEASYGAALLALRGLGEFTGG